MSTSSEIVDSETFSGLNGARAPEKSNFSQTCNLLSHYLKEKATFGDLNLGMPNEGTTMNLFPVAEKSSQSSFSPPQNINFFPQQTGFASPTTTKQEVPKKKADVSLNKAQPESSQMTIFYKGQVIVFNDFPADKAKEIMLLASKGSLNNPNPNPFPSAPIQKPAEPPKLAAPAPSLVRNLSNNNIAQERVQLQRPPQPVVSDLPIARKASLTRFLEKRKDRITARSPYQTGNSAATLNSKPGESKSWLGLGARSPLQLLPSPGPFPLL